MDPIEARFTMTPEVERTLRGPEKKAEYVMCCPMDIEVALKSGEVLHPQEVRERVVRCRDCEHGDPFCDSSSYAGMINCLHFSQWDYYNDELGSWPVKPDGFCAWGKPREEA